MKLAMKLAELENDVAFHDKPRDGIGTTIIMVRRNSGWSIRCNGRYEHNLDSGELLPVVARMLLRKPKGAEKILRRPVDHAASNLYLIQSEKRLHVSINQQESRLREIKLRNQMLATAKAAIRVSKIKKKTRST